MIKYLSTSLLATALLAHPVSADSIHATQKGHGRILLESPQNMKLTTDQTEAMIILKDQAAGGGPIDVKVYSFGNDDLLAQTSVQADTETGSASFPVTLPPDRASMMFRVVVTLEDDSATNVFLVNLQR